MQMQKNCTFSNILQKVKSYFFDNLYHSPCDSYWNSKKSIKLKPPTTRSSVILFHHGNKCTTFCLRFSLVQENNKHKNSLGRVSSGEAGLRHVLTIRQDAGKPNQTWTTISRTAKTQYRKFETNVPRTGTAWLQSQFLHSCFSVRFIYSSDRSTGKWVGRTWKYVDRS